jgi:hypothetical protein
MRLPECYRKRQIDGGRRLEKISIGGMMRSFSIVPAGIGLHHCYHWYSLGLRTPAENQAYKIFLHGWGRTAEKISSFQDGNRNILTAENKMCLFSLGGSAPSMGFSDPRDSTA